MVGYSTSGSEDTGKNRTATRPTSTRAIISSDVATGRSTNRREMFMGGRREPFRQLAPPAPCVAAPAFFLTFEPGGEPGVVGAREDPAAG